MWTDPELTALQKTIPEAQSVKSILTQEEIDVIVENSTRFINLKPGMMVPMHKRMVINYFANTILTIHNVVHR